MFQFCALLNGVLKLDDKTIDYLVFQPKWTFLSRAPAETVECASRTV